MRVPSEQYDSGANMRPDLVEEFAALTGRGEIEYFHIDAVPRSMSTTIPIALVEASVADDTRYYTQCDEPLNWKTRGGGLEAIVPTLLDLKGAQPTTIFEKSTARNVYPDTFTTICAVAKGVIFTVRHPHKQMYALAQRIANDLVYGKGADELVLSELPTDERRALLQKVDDFLALSGHLDGVIPAEERPYMQPSWREICDNFRHATRVGLPLAVIDGTALTTHPSQTLQRICGILDIPYSDAMVNGWSVVKTRNAFHKDHTNWPATRTQSGGFTNGWIARATSTSGIEPDLTPLINPADCPPRMQTYITEIAEPVYSEMTAHPSSNTILQGLR